MGKTFTSAPRPGSLEAIEAYERGGPGHDNVGLCRLRPGK